MSTSDWVWLFIGILAGCFVVYLYHANERVPRDREDIKHVNGSAVRPPPQD